MTKRAFTRKQADNEELHWDILQPSSHASSSGASHCRTLTYAWQLIHDSKVCSAYLYELHHIMMACPMTSCCELKICNAPLSRVATPHVGSFHHPHCYFVVTYTNWHGLCAVGAFFVSKGYADFCLLKKGHKPFQNLLVTGYDQEFWNVRRSPRSTEPVI